MNFRVTFFLLVVISAVLFLSGWLPDGVALMGGGLWSIGNLLLLDRLFGLVLRKNLIGRGAALGGYLLAKFSLLYGVGILLLYLFPGATAFALAGFSLALLTAGLQARPGAVRV